MFDHLIEEQVKRLIAQHTVLVRGISTGVGLTIPGRLFRPGLSKVLYSWHIPYATDDLDTIVKCPECKSVSARVAIKAAESLAISQEGDLAIAITGAVQTSRERKGADQVFIAARAIIDGKHIAKLHRVVFEKQGWTRETQEDFIVFCALNLIHSFTHSQYLTFDEKLPGKVWSLDFTDNGLGGLRITYPVYSHFPSSGTNYVQTYSDKLRVASNFKANEVAIIPLSGNPVHEGHLRMAQVMTDLGYYPIFQFERNHPDKGVLTPAEADERALQLFGRAHVEITNGLALLCDKWRFRAGSAFAIGADTFIRIQDPKYGVATDDVLQSIVDNDIKLFIFERDGLKIEAPSLIRNRVVFVGGLPQESSTRIRETFSLGA